MDIHQKTATIGDFADEMQGHQPSEVSVEVNTGGTNNDRVWAVLLTKPDGSTVRYTGRNDEFDTLDNLVTRFTQWLYWIGRRDLILSLLELVTNGQRLRLVFKRVPTPPAQTTIKASKPQPAAAEVTGPAMIGYVRFDGLDGWGVKIATR